MTRRTPITFLTREELEAELGPPDRMSVDFGTAEKLREWAERVIGEPAAAVMPLPQIVNLYHERCGDADRWGAALNAVAMHCIAALSKPIDPETIRLMIRQEVENIAPRPIEIITPDRRTVLQRATHYKTAQILQIVAIGHAVMMVGPAGCGKTTIGEHIAEALNLPFHITNTVHDAHELTGFIDGYGKYHDTAFRRAFENGGVWIADEIDAWDANAFLVVNSALANGFASFPDMATPLRRHADFRMVGTANTFGSGADRMYVGRNELDAASLDRFAVVSVSYDLTLERMFSAGADKWLERVWNVRRIVEEKKIRHVVSSRAVGMGAAALAAGLLWDDVEAVYLFKGMSASDRKKIDDNS